MKHETYSCDRCSTTVYPNTDARILQTVYRFIGEGQQYQKWDMQDFCPPCLDSFDKWIKRKS